MTNAGFSSKRGLHDPAVDDTFALEVEVQLSDAVTTTDGSSVEVYLALQFKESAIAVGGLKRASTAWLKEIVMVY